MLSVAFTQAGTASALAYFPLPTEHSIAAALLHVAQQAEGCCNTVQESISDVDANTATLWPDGNDTALQSAAAPALVYGKKYSMTQRASKHQGCRRMSIPQLREKLESPGVKARHAGIDILVFP